MNLLAGLDIGGTKCAVCLGQVTPTEARVVSRRWFPTQADPGETLQRLGDELKGLLDESSQKDLSAIGISCGGPLDSRRGVVLSPPNLPGWDAIDVVSPFQRRFGVPVGLQNDANACALAEWRWGAGRGCQNLVFLTFGTGMGAGLILNGNLYSGTNDMAGEAGHIRLEGSGPVGYGKAGSFEGFCSGGGIAKLAAKLAEEALARGNPPAFCLTPAELAHITAEKVGAAAQQGDALALEVFQVVGRQLGRGLAILVDLLNPERIVIGSIYARQRFLLEEITLKTLQEEALPESLAVCQVMPAGLGENVGDLASLSVAWGQVERKPSP